MSTPRREPTIAELSELSRYATNRVALYRRKLFAGGGEPRRLVELERTAAGAADRLRRATKRITKETR